MAEQTVTAAAPAGHARGIGIMLLVMVIMACMDAMSKHLAVTYPVPQILAIRFVFFCGFALAIVRPRSLRAAFATRHPVLQVLRSLVIAVEVGVFILAFRYLPLADVHAIAGIAPLLVTAMAVLLLGEQVGPRRWTAIGIGFVGLLIILRPGLSALGPAALIPLGGAVLWALYQVLVRMVKDDSAGTSMLYMAVIGAIVMGAIAPFVWVAPDLEGWLWLLALSLTASIGHYLLIIAFRAAPASVLQPFHYTVLIWATIVGYAVFGDFPDGWTILGGAVIAFSGVYVFYRERVRRG